MAQSVSSAAEPGGRVVRRLQFDGRTQAVVEQVHAGFQVQGVGIGRQARAEPAEEGADVRTMRIVEAGIPGAEAGHARVCLAAGAAQE